MARNSERDNGQGLWVLNLRIIHFTIRTKYFNYFGNMLSRLLVNLKETRMKRENIRFA